MWGAARALRQWKDTKRVSREINLFLVSCSRGQCSIPGLGTNVRFNTALLVRKVVVACRIAGFPKRYEQRGSLIVVGVEFTWRKLRISKTRKKP